MNDERAQELLKEYGEAVNDYRAFLRKKIKESAGRLQRERDYSIKCAESGQFTEIHPDSLVHFRVELETYEEAAYKLEEILGSDEEGENQ